MTYKNNQDIRFIRKNGKVIPIKNKNGGSYKPKKKSNKRGKTPKKTSRKLEFSMLGAGTGLMGVGEAVRRYSDVGVKVTKKAGIRKPRIATLDSLKKPYKGYNLHSRITRFKLLEKGFKTKHYSRVLKLQKGLKGFSRFGSAITIFGSGVAATGGIIAAFKSDSEKR